MRILIALAVLLAGCSGDEVDLVCTKALYDPCDTEDDCTSGLCMNFFMAGFQVCSQTCDAARPCPAGGACETGSCQPAKPTDCALQHR